jgi:predicted Zn-dependent protease
MIRKDKCKSIVALAVSHAAGRADEIEVTVSGSDIATSRFAVNGMTQNQCPERISVSVLVRKDGRQARQETEDYSAAGIRQVVDGALAAAALMEPEENLQPMPGTQLVEELAKLAGAKPRPRYHSKTALMTAADRAAAVRAMIDVARKHGLVAAGVYATGSMFVAIGNSHGVFQYHHESSAECSITMEGPTSSGWDKAHSTDAKDFDPAQVAENAAQTCLAGANPTELAPGRYTVVLAPSAVLDLVCSLWGDFTGTSVIDQLSSLTGKVGTKLFGDNITVVDDVYHHLQAGAPFDGEGLPRTRVTLIDHGVVTGLVHSRISAAKLGVCPTGHSLQQPSSLGEAASNIVISGGTMSVDDMVKSVEKGVYVTRVWYIRAVDPETVLLTGMTRDGTFLIENGAIAGPIKNFRFNVSMHELFRNVLAMSRSVRAAGEEGSPEVVPAMLVANFNFTEVTKF